MYRFALIYQSHAPTKHLCILKSHYLYAFHAVRQFPASPTHRCSCALLTYSISPWHGIIAFWHCIDLLGNFLYVPDRSEHIGHIYFVWFHEIWRKPARWSRVMNCSVSDSLYQMPFLIARLPDSQEGTIDSLNEQSRIWWEQWSVHEVLSSLHFWSSYTGLSRHTQELCLFICFVLVTFHFML